MPTATCRPPSISALAARAGVWGVRVHDVAGTRVALEVVGALGRRSATDEPARSDHPHRSAGVRASRRASSTSDARVRPFVIDVTVHLALADAAAGDDLSAHRALRRARRAGRRRRRTDPVDLIETVAERVAEVALVVRARAARRGDRAQAERPDHRAVRRRQRDDLRGRLDGADARRGRGRGDRARLEPGRSRSTPWSPRSSELDAVEGVEVVAVVAADRDDRACGPTAPIRTHPATSTPSPSSARSSPPTQLLDVLHDIEAGPRTRARRALGRPHARPRHRELRRARTADRAPHPAAPAGARAGLRAATVAGGRSGCRAPRARTGRRAARPARRDPQHRIRSTRTARHEAHPAHHSDRPRPDRRGRRVPRAAHPRLPRASPSCAPSTPWRSPWSSSPRS